MSLNQDYALALWRKDAAFGDPALYAVASMFGRAVAWLNVNGNIGWYSPEIEGDDVVGLRSISLPQPSSNESAESKLALNYALKYLSPKQRRKIAHVISRFKASA